MQQPVIGCIGQGFVGKSYADEFEERGYKVIRYAKEEPYIGARDTIAEADIVFIAVPTPTTREGFDDSIVREVTALVGVGKIAVIKSTVLPGTTDSIQTLYPDRTILFSPEFLVEATAAEDAQHPIMNIVGVPEEGSQEAAETVLRILPKSDYTQICSAKEAELIKYAHNTHAFFRILFMNILYDLVEAHGLSWETIKQALDADPYLGVRASYYNNPVHKSGRGAGGSCFPKDFAAFRDHYAGEVDSETGRAVLEALEKKNIELLCRSQKDLERLEAMYGPNPCETHNDRQT